jgi:hypothetical protein
MNAAGADQAVAARQVPLEDWRALDWRMLLPTGELRRVLYVGDAGGPGVAALSSLVSDLQILPTARAAPVSPTGADVVVVADARGGRDEEMRRWLAALRPGGWLVLPVRARRLRPASGWRARARRCGFASVAAYWNAPSFDRCSYVVSVDDRHGIRAVLARHQGVRLGRAKAAAARALLAGGAFGLVARDTIVIAQRPPDE